MEASDLDLLHDSAGGDRSAFDELMRRHEDRIYSLCLRMLGNPTDALDATQDTFIKVFRRAGDFRGDAAFSTWVYRIGINACKDLIRRKARQPVPQEEIHAVEPSQTGFDDQVLLRADLAAALQQLSEDYRTAVVMHDIGGIPYEDIAKATDAAIGTVKSRISRGRRQLAALLEQPSTPGASKGKI